MIKNKLREILKDKTSIEDDVINEIIDEFSGTYYPEIEQFKKTKLDILNWVKSLLAEEENHKLDKTMNAYRTDKILFLRKIINKFKL